MTTGEKIHAVKELLGLQGCELKRGWVPWALKDIDTTVYPNKTPDKNPPTGC